MGFFFLDRVTAYHSALAVQSDGSRKSVRDSVPFVDGMRCQLSYGGDDYATPKGKVRYPQKRDMKVYIVGIGHGFKSGDWIIVRRKGAIVYEGAIGEPKVYDRLLIHTELSLDANYKGNSNG